MGDGSADAAIRALVESNPGQASFEEYQLVHELISAKAPCNVLVFGVGRDTALWLGANAGGHTVFLENVSKWAAYARAHMPGIVVHDVRYRTLRALWQLHRRTGRLLYMRDLPPDIQSTQWDVVLVDSPKGNHWYRPGRMKSIYTASVLGRRGGVDVLVHDCDRPVERQASDQFLSAYELVSELRRMRHYRFRSP